MDEANSPPVDPCPPEEREDLNNGEESILS